MTVTYTLAVSTSHPWTFLSLLFRWRGSVWKAVWIQLLVWLISFYIISFSFRFFMNEYHQKQFSFAVAFLAGTLDYMPMDLILGFFVTAILDRWKYLYNIIGWMDNIALYTAMYVRGTGERPRMYRRNIVRYCQLTQVLVFRDLSLRARKRFPTLDTVQAAGFMSQHERDRFEEIQYGYSKYFLPFNWAWALTYNARKEGFIESDYFQAQISDEIKKFRTDLAWLCNYDWVPLPLIYPTIVCSVVHLYFLVAVFARQYTTGDDTIDLYFPFMTVLQFILYMGWLKKSKSSTTAPGVISKTGEVLLNPWGEDDDDFETNTLIDRNLTMGLKIVDEGYGKTPELKKDDFWDHEWTPLYAEDYLEPKHRMTEGSISHIKLPKSTSAIRMVPLASGQLSKAGSKARIVPVKPEDMEENTTMEKFKGMLRTFSRGNLVEMEMGRKVFSTSHLDKLPQRKSRSHDVTSDWARVLERSKVNGEDIEIALKNLQKQQEEEADKE